MRVFHASGDIGGGMLSFLLFERASDMDVFMIVMRLCFDVVLFLRACVVQISVGE